MPNQFRAIGITIVANMEQWLDEQVPGRMGSHEVWISGTQSNWVLSLVTSSLEHARSAAHADESLENKALRDLASKRFSWVETIA